jgi:ketosteroid isomerase-like protein
MSQENVEIVRAAFDAWSRGDLDAWLAEADPDIEWYVLPDAPDPGPHRGRRAILERAALWRDMLTETCSRTPRRARPRHRFAARSSNSANIGPKRRPSKPCASRSRPCRRRTWNS